MKLSSVYRVAILDTLEEVINACTAWQTLVETCGRDTPVSARPSWAVAWLGQYHDRAQPCIVLVYRCDELVAVFPLCRVGHQTEVVTLGDPLVDETAIVAHAECEDGVLQVLIAGTLAALGTSHSLRLPLVGESAKRLVAEMCVRRGGVLLSRRAVPIIHNVSCWSQLEPRLSASRRKRFRHDLSRLQALHSLEFRVVNNRIEGEQSLAILLRNRASTLDASGRDAVFHPWTTDAAFGSFLARLLREAMPKGELVITELRLDGIPAAHALLLIGGRRALYYVAGRNGQCPKISLGLMNLRLTIDWALRDGTEVFDFGLGDEAYKYQLGAQDEWREDWLYDPGTMSLE